MKKPQRGAFLAAGLCFALALILRFALVGYGTLALCFAAAGVCVLLYAFLPKKFRVMLTVLLALCLLLFAVGEVPVLLAMGGTPDFDADWLIVLGAGVNGDTPSLSLLNRLRTAKDYLDAHPDCRAVLTGGQGSDENLSEAEAMYLWLTAQGIDPARLVREDRAASTRENVAFSLPLIPDAAHQHIAVCSSEYHLYRAQYFARQMGYEFGGVPAKTTLPVLKLNYFIRESFCVLYFWVF